MFRPHSRSHNAFRPTFPIGRYLSQPLGHPCADLSEVRLFLSSCKYVSDAEQFGREDYWQPPEEFEKNKKGDCEDFALWSWRQLLEMKYPARFVIGRATRYGDGHAWVTFEKEGKHFLLESLSWPIGLKLPRISTLRYKPRYSVSWDGQRVSYFEHQETKFNGSLQQVVFLVSEWVVLWAKFWARLLPSLGKGLVRKLFSSKSR